MRQEQNHEYYTTYEFAERFRISLKTVYRLIKRGRIPAVRMGHQWRIPVDVAESFAPSRAHSQEVQR